MSELRRESTTSYSKYRRLSLAWRTKSMEGSLRLKMTSKRLVPLSHKTGKKISLISKNKCETICQPWKTCQVGQWNHSSRLDKISRKTMSRKMYLVRSLIKSKRSTQNLPFRCQNSLKIIQMDSFLRMIRNFRISSKRLKKYKAQCSPRWISGDHSKPKSKRRDSGAFKIKSHNLSQIR